MRLNQGFAAFSTSNMRRFRASAKLMVARHAPQTLSVRPKCGPSFVTSMALFYAAQRVHNTFSPSRSHAVLKATFRLPLPVTLAEAMAQVRARTGKYPMPAMTLQDASGTWPLTQTPAVYELPARDPLQPYEEPHFVLTYTLPETPAERALQAEFLRRHTVAAGGRASASGSKRRQQKKRVLGGSSPRRRPRKITRRRAAQK